MVAPHVAPVVIASVPFYVLQVCMIVFVCRTRRVDETYRTGFFTVYAALSTADCALMTVVSLVATRLYVTKKSFGGKKHSLCLDSWHVSTG